MIISLFSDYFLLLPLNVYLAAWPNATDDSMKYIVGSGRQFLPPNLIGFDTLCRYSIGIEKVDANSNNSL